MIGFFGDAGMSVPAVKLKAMQASDGSSAAVDFIYYLASDDADRTYYAASDPDVDDIVVSIVDAAAGASLPPTALRLALAAEDLATATPGAALAIGTALASGSVNAVAIHVRVDSAAIAASVYENLSLATNPMISQWTGD